MRNRFNSGINFGDVHQNNITIIQPTNENKILVDQLINQQINEYRDYAKLDPINSLQKLQKIEQDNFSHIDDKTKYRLLVNIAVAYERQNKKQETAEYLIKAKEYSEDSTAFYYAIYGYLLQNNRKKSEKLYSELKAKNSQNNYVFMSKILLNNFNNIYPLEKDLHASKMSDKDIIRILAVCYYEAKKDKKALIWLEKYHSINSEDIEMQSLYAFSLLNYIVSQDEISFGGQWQKDDMDKLNLAIQLFTDLWEKYDSKENKKLHLLDGINLCRSLQLIGNWKNANQIVKELLKIDKTNFEVCYCYADIFARQEKFGKAILPLESIFGNNNKTDFMLIELLLHNKQYPDVLDKIEKLDKTSLDDLYKEYLNIFQSIAIYCKQDRDAAYEFIDGCDFSIFDSLLGVFNFYHNIAKDDNKSSAQLQLIEGNLTDDISYYNKLHLADIYYRLGKYEKSINLYQQLNINKPSGILNRLLDALFKVNDRIGIQNILNNFDDNNKDSDFYIAASTNFYFLTGELNKAKLQINKAIKKYPDNLHYRLLWVNILKRTQQNNEIKAYLDTKPIFPDAAPDDQMELVKLFRDNGQFEVAIKLGYEILRNNWSNVKSHTVYSMVIVMTCSEEIAVLNASKIAIDTTFTITNNFNETKIYTIVDNADTSFSEINLNHYITKKAIGKKTGDTFITEHTQKKEWTIKEVASKYVGLFRKSIAKFNELFPDNRDMSSINIRQGKEFEDISQFIDSSNENINNIYEIYQKDSIPISSLAKFSKENIIKLWQSLLTNQSVKVNINTPVQTIAEPLKNDNGYIVDAITLYFIFALNAHNDIKQYLKNIAIVQATLDTFLQLREDNISMPCMTIGKQGDQYYCQDITEQDVKNRNNFMQELHDWTNNNCQIIPADGNLANKHNNFNEIFDLSTAETLIAAESSKKTLLTDDRNLRTVCGFFKIDSICSKDVLYYNKNTSSQTYYGCLHQLRLMNCVYIPLEVWELWHWIEQCKTVDDLTTNNEIQTIKKYRDDFINIVNFDQSYFEYMQYSKNAIIDVIFYILIADKTPYIQEKINWLMDNLYIDYENFNLPPHADKSKLKMLEVVSFLISNAFLSFIEYKVNTQEYTRWIEQNFLQKTNNGFIKQIASELFNRIDKAFDDTKDSYIECFINSMPIAIKMELSKISNKKITK